MSNQEIDREIAEKLFGDALPQVWADSSVGPSHGDPGGYRVGIRPYSSDIAAAMLVEEKIKELGQQDGYGKALCEIVGVGADSLHRFGRKFTHALLDGGEVFAIAHASAEARCRAAIKVVEGK